MNGFVRYLPYLFPVFFIVLWCFIIWLFSFLSGWRKMAGTYYQGEKFQGELIRYQSARMNLVNLRHVLNMGLSEKGLYLVPMTIFRPFHKPLFIPWEEILAEPDQRVLLYSYRLRFRSVPGVNLYLYQAAFQKILDFLEEYPDRLVVEGQASSW